MPPERDESEPAAAGQVPPEEFGHPRGTLAIVITYGLLFLLGWIAVYVFRFLERGAPQP